MRKPNYDNSARQLLPSPESNWTPPKELPDLRYVKEFGIDTEEKDEGLTGGQGSGWVYRAGHMAGFSVAWGSIGREQGIYVPLAHPETQNFNRENVRQWLIDHRHVRWIMHNAPYDLGWFRAEFDLDPPEQIDDTTALAIMLDENWLSYQLGEVAKRCGLPGKNEFLLKEAAAFYGFHPKRDLWNMPAKYVGPYAEDDALATLRIARQLRPQIIEEGIQDAYQTEMELIPLVQEMRHRGIRIDLDHAERSRDELYRRRDAAFQELSQRLNGRKVGMEEIGRTAWLQQVFDEQGITYPRTAPTSRFPDGQPSFTAGVLGWMHLHPHWLPQLIVKADRYHNAASKFLQGYIIDYTHKGRLHASINQFLSEDEEGRRSGTRSHRFSYSDPPLQQMPSRDPEFKEYIRGCFLPEQGEAYCRIDYSQQEIRLMVHFAHLARLSTDKLSATATAKVAVAVQRYNDDPNTDFHKIVAEWTGLTSPEQRYSVKQASFAKAYNASMPKFAKLIRKSEAETQEIWDKYDKELPFVTELNEKCRNLANRRGFIRLIDGARMHYPLWEGPWLDKEARRAATQAGHTLTPCRLAEAQRRMSNPEHPWADGRIRRADTRKAMNALIQGSAARQTKKAMLDCWKAGIVPLIQIHDELGLSAAGKEIGEKAAEIMRNAIPLTIPAAADPEYGESWANAKLSWGDWLKDIS